MYSNCLVICDADFLSKKVQIRASCGEKRPSRGLFNMYRDGYNLLFAVGSSCCRRTRPYKESLIGLV